MQVTETALGAYTPQDFGHLLHAGQLTPWGTKWAELLTLRTSDARLEAWAALHDVGGALQAPPDVEAELAAYGLTLDDAMALADALDQASRTPYQRAKAAVDAALSTRCKRPAHQLGAWHYAGIGPLGASEDTRGVRAPFFEEVSLRTLVIRFFDGLGMNARGHVEDLEVPALIAQETLIALVRQTATAMAARYASGDPIGPIVDAAVGAFLADATSSLDFVDAYLPAHRERASLFAGHFTQGVRHRALEQARWALVRFHFDRARHRDDLESHWWRLRKGFQGVDRNGAPALSWVGSVEGGVSGVDCLLTTTARIALGHRLRQAVGPGIVEHFGVGATLIGEVLRPGAAQTWAELVPRRDLAFWREALSAGDM